MLSTLARSRFAACSIWQSNKVFAKSVSSFAPIPGSNSFSKRSYVVGPIMVPNEFPDLSNTNPPKATEIRLSKKTKTLTISWDNGCKMIFPSEFLRVESPSAEVQGHGPSNQKRLIFGRKYVSIMDIEEQGHYGILLKFDDLHESGIYTWQYLYWLGRNKYTLMKKYIRNLRQFNKSRDPKQNQPKKPVS